MLIGGAGVNEIRLIGLEGIPEVKPGDVITLKPKMGQVLEDTRGAVIPPWLSVERNVGRVIGMPRRQDLDPNIRESLIVEFYAR